MNDPNQPAARTPLSAYDAQLAELRERHPGWRIWYVPGLGQTTWCAQPLPNLTAYSPKDLSKAIRESEDAGD